MLAQGQFSTCQQIVRPTRIPPRPQAHLRHSALEIERKHQPAPLARAPHYRDYPIPFKCHKRCNARFPSQTQNNFCYPNISKTGR